MNVASALHRSTRKLKLTALGKNSEYGKALTGKQGLSAQDNFASLIWLNSGPFTWSQHLPS